MISLVLALEALNSALERLIDHLHPAIHPEMGMVKDMCAGGGAAEGIFRDQSGTLAPLATHAPAPP